MTVMIWYRYFLYTSENLLKKAIDVYNQGGLSEKARLALEIIDNQDSPPVWKSETLTEMQKIDAMEKVGYNSYQIVSALSSPATFNG